MDEDFISKEHANMMRSLSPWEDGDTYPLGNGRLAEYDHRGRVFIILEGGKRIGEVPKSAIFRRKK